MMYKFISYDEYMETEEVVDEEGNSTTVRISPYAASHQHARVNIERTEVVLSCNSHTEGCGCLTHAETLKYIDENWEKAPEE
jgi:hypothetical protein